MSTKQCDGAHCDVTTELLPVMPMKFEQSLAAVLLVSGVTGCISTDVPRPSPPIKSYCREMCSAPPKEERYYLLLFTSQFAVKLPRYTHTWATVVRATEPNANRLCQ